MSRDLRDRTIVITGASSGIGAATAVACARAGMHCVLNGRQANALVDVAARVRAVGRRAETVVGDVTDEALNARLLDAAEERLGGLYAVFANAGYGFKRPAHEVEDPELRRIFEVNFFAANDLLRQAARRLLAHKQRGHLLMCSSALAKFTTIRFSAYSATKAAQNHVCRAMRMELRDHGIAVSSVHPITTRTPFFHRSGEMSGHTIGPERAFDHVPRWLLQSPEQVADAVVRCLRRPRAEVWTSRLVPVVAGLMMVFPGLMDRIGRARD